MLCNCVVYLTATQFGARDLRFSYLGSGVRTDKHVVWIDQKVEDAIRRPKRFGYIRR